MDRNFRWALPVILVLLSALKAEVAWHKYIIHGYAQGTDYTITYYAEDSLLVKQEVDELLTIIDSSMSLYKPYSLINRINDSNEETFQVDTHFSRVIQQSFEIYRNSNGRFDITVAPLVKLWGFGVDQVDHLPDSAEVRSVCACVGMEHIQLTGTSLKKKKPCIQLDLNGIAQGYSVDVLADLLISKGIDRYLIELGGELRVSGPKPNGEPMRIGIERPPKEGVPGFAISEVIELRDGAVTTAGNYRKFISDGKQVISHHIDPKTGYPFRSGTISATVYAPDAMTADGYDNVFIAMPAADAIAFANDLADIEVYLIYHDNNGVVSDTMSAGFERLISKQRGVKN